MWFDLAVNGPAALSSVTGTVTTNGASLSAPNLRTGLQGIDATVALARNRANLNISGEATNGGRVQVGGSVTLTGSLPADISVALRDVVLIDPRLYKTSVSGDLRIAGPLTGGAGIAGQINVGETVVNVPSTGLTSIGTIPDITHVGSRAGATATRGRAGLGAVSSGSDVQASSSGYLRFVSATDTPNGEVRVIVEGPADEPEVTFESTPAGPQDEVLAQLLFGRNISEISAFQALQLASAVATLAGRGGNGIIGNLRDGFGLDDLDVTTTDSGATALRLGKYISDNIYTDVTAASDGTADVSLNIDSQQRRTIVCCCPGHPVKVVALTSEMPREVQLVAAQYVDAKLGCCGKGIVPLGRSRGRPQHQRRIKRD